MRRALWLLLLVGCSSRDEHVTIDRLDCNSCHAAEYDALEEHEEEGYPRTCYSCHGLHDWDEAAEEHDRFVIDRGAHAGWDCSDCHLSKTDRLAIRCTACHAHDEARTRPPHRGVSGFEYSPASCLRCHNKGGN